MPTEQSRRCLIFGAGPCNLLSFQKTQQDFVIAADGGYLHLRRLGVTPDLVMGDFDSLKEVPDHPHILRHNPVKDDSDMLLAVKTALGQGHRLFYLYGGLGGRLDHTLANLQTLAYLANNGARAYLIGEGTVVTAIKNAAIRFQSGCEGYLSVFCQGEPAHGVYESGLKYSLTNATLTPDNPLGLSNEFTGRPASVRVGNGTLLLLWQHPHSTPADSLGIDEASC